MVLLLRLLRYHLELTCTSEFFKKLKLHEPRKYSRWGRSFLKPFFLIRQNVFQTRLLHKIFVVISRDVIGLENFQF